MIEVSLLTRTSSRESSTEVVAAAMRVYERLLLYRIGVAVPQISNAGSTSHRSK